MEHLQVVGETGPEGWRQEAPMVSYRVGTIFLCHRTNDVRPYDLCALTVGNRGGQI
jgi:hypothetical protein